MPIPGNVPRLLEIFSEALELNSVEERAVYLDRACGADWALRGRVEGLLDAHVEGDSFLESPASAPTLTATPGDRIGPEAPGTTIGPYKLLEAIGEGGMGTVYMAEQSEPVRRRVALKVIKPGMDSKQVVARFDAERQALAMMDHPNIAKVHDGGMTPSGRPYFVMELVPGLPITEYCDREVLTIRERLELFVLVCRAVQHAHQKGIIHRDLKPSNVLVTVIDGVGVPKVIDFGVAKAAGQALTEKTLFTGFQQFVGTPLYTSPEQAEFSGVDVDTRSDIYSLGVLLYELLTGTTPFDSETLERAAFDEMRRIIREEEPPRPSTRLGMLGEALSTVSARRKSDPWRLGASMKGELDWVVMKALEKDRRRRYETANDFAADVRRYLADRPVEACPPSAMYRFKKYSKRHQAALTTAGLLGLALLAGTAVSTWLAYRAIRAENDAETARDQAERRLAISERHLYAARLHDANDALDALKFERAQEILDEIRPGPDGADQRDFAWHYLWNKARRDIVVYPRHSTTVDDPILLDGGRRIAYDTEAGEVVIVDTTTEQVVRTLTGHKIRGSILLAASAEGRTLASARWSKTPEAAGEVLIWDVSSGSIVGRIDIQTPAIHHLWLSESGRILSLSALTPEIGTFIYQYNLVPDPAHPKLLRKIDHRELSAPTRDGQVFRRIRDNEFVKIDIASGETTKFPLSDSEVVEWCKVSPDGRRFVHLDEGQHDIVWSDTATGVETDRHHTGTLTTKDIWLSEHADTVAILTASNEIFVQDRTSGTSRTIVPEGANRASWSIRIALSADGRFIAITTWGIPDGQTPVRVHDFRTGSVVATYPGRLDAFGVMCFAPDGRSVYLSSGNSIKRWNLYPQAPVEPAGHADEAWSLAFMPDGRHLFSGSDNTDEKRMLKVWDLANGKPVTTARPQLGTISALAISPDGERLAVGALSGGRNMSCWNIKVMNDASRWKLTYRDFSISGFIRTVAFSHDGKNLAISGDDRLVHLFEGTSMEKRAVLKGHTDKVRQVAFSPVGNILASVSNDDSVRLWDLATSQQIGILNGPRPFTTLAFSPDGKALAVGDQTGLVRFVDPTTMTETARIHSEDSELRSIAYTPDGRILAAAGMNRTIRLWDTLTHQNLLDLKGHEAQINALAFSPDGTTLASCDHAGKVKLWTTREAQAP